MNEQPATEHYAHALRLGQKEYRELLTTGQSPYPAVLDEIFPDHSSATRQEIGLVEIPSQLITGVVSAGRISALTAGFRPLLDADSEFACKWIALCKAHLGDVGIQQPIECVEYLGRFYVQEGNKRVSVLRFFDAPRIPGMVTRILPEPSDEPRIKAYYEFLDFYKVSKLYSVQFRRPGDYASLLSLMGKDPNEVWTEEERKAFSAHFQYFRQAFDELNGKRADVLPEEALLLWLKLYPYQDLALLSAAQLKKTLSELWEDVVSTFSQKGVKVQTKAEDPTKVGFLARFLSGSETLKVAFIHQLDPQTSTWVLGHEEGKAYLEAELGDRVSARSYFHSDTEEQTLQNIELAIAEGAQVVFTTAPILSRATLKAAVKHPKVRFLNCSVDQPYSSIRTYYARIYEAKFITGAIAGAMADNNRIGYIASYPIFGVPASINAFALGAQLTNPRAKIDLRWSCCAEGSQGDFFADGIRVVSNRDMPTQSRMFLDFCNYGTYQMDDRGNLVPLGSPVWVWGKFYTFVVQSILSGGWKQEKGTSTALNYWLGMDSGLIDIRLSDKLPDGVRAMAQGLRQGVIDGQIDPFCRRIVSQDGTLRNDGSLHFTPNTLLHMDWLCENVSGEIPGFDKILPISQSMVRELGIYRDQIPARKEAAGSENSDRI
ncbi:MAG: BMP family ABC transporter substrate-binding protein [Faecousia sp.]